MSLRNSDELGAQLIFGHSNDQYTCIAVNRQMVDGGHLMRDVIFHYHDGYFLLRSFCLHLIWILMESIWSLMSGLHLEISRRFHFNIP